MVRLVFPASEGALVRMVSTAEALIFAAARSSVMVCGWAEKLRATTAEGAPEGAVRA